MSSKDLEREDFPTFLLAGHWSLPYFDSVSAFFFVCVLFVFSLYEPATYNS